MSEELFIPKLGQTVEEVVLTAWLLEDGARVDFGDPVLEVETDKAVFTVEANAKGFLHRGPQQAGETLPVLTVVAVIGKVDEIFAVKSIENKPDVQELAIPADEETKQKSPADQMPGRDQLFVSPRARKLAGEKNVDLGVIQPSGGGGSRIVEKDVLGYLEQVPKATPVAQAMAEKEGLSLAGLVGTGPRGIISREDVEKALQARKMTKQAPGPVAVGIAKQVPITGKRKVIFEKMGTSSHTTARVTLVSEVDATELVSMRTKLKEIINDAWGFTPGYNELLGLITARCLRQFPYMNARVSADQKTIEWLEQVNLGIAVDTDSGLVVPVFHDADKMSLHEFGLVFRELVGRAKERRMTLEDIGGGSFTITNLGEFGIDAFTPVINYPEAAILGIGQIKDKPVVFNGEITIRKMVTLSLVFDHRIIDGAPAARFLQAVGRMIENPLGLFVD